MHAKPTCGIVTGGNHTSAIWAATNSNRHIYEVRIVSLFYGRVKAVHVDVDDLPDGIIIGGRGPEAA